MRITEIKKKLLSNTWKPLWLYTYLYHRLDGSTEKQVREIYDKGDGAAVLLIDKLAKKVLLTKQFRMPAFLNHHKDGFITEVAAGMLDNDGPEDCIIREIFEETGYQLNEVTYLFNCFMTPGAVTEKTYFYLGYYNESLKVGAGGGLREEHEEIELLTYDFDEIKKMLIQHEFEDAKTILLLQYALLYKLLL